MNTAERTDFWRYVRDNIVGGNVRIQTPFGVRRLTYCDYTASGRLVSFVEEYLKDLSATQAAIRAGYSSKRADQQGYENLRKPEIQSAIIEAMAERSERTRIDSDWLLKRLAAEANANLADLFTKDNTLKPAEEWPEIWQTGLVAGLDVKEVWEGTGKDRVQVGRVIKVKLSDRLKRLVGVV